MIFFNSRQWTEKKIYWKKKMIVALPFSMVPLCLSHFFSFSLLPPSFSLLDSVIFTCLRFLSARCKYYFDSMLAQRGYTGSMTFDHKNETLSITVRSWLSHVASRNWFNLQFVNHHLPFFPSFHNPSFFFVFLSYPKALSPPPLHLACNSSL